MPDISIYYPDLKSGKTIIDHDNEDGKVDGMIVDEGSDQSWDYSFWDTDFDGKWDLEGIHLNGEINPSSFKGLDNLFYHIFLTVSNSIIQSLGEFCS